MDDIKKNQKETVVLGAVSTEEDDSMPLVLTERDIAMFRLIHEHRYLALDQIGQAFWKHQTSVTKFAGMHVRRLVIAGFLEMRHSVRMGLDLYLLTEESLRELQTRGMDLAIGKYELSDDFEMFVDHDLKVANIRILFRELGIENWMSERVIKADGATCHVPDGAFNMVGRRIAVEFENVLKGKTHYLHLFKRYASSDDYYLVIMVVGRDLREWLLDLDYNAEQVWFVDYQDLMQKREQVMLDNNGDTFQLARIL